MFGAMYAYELPRYTKFAVPITWAVQPVNMVVNTEWWESLPPKDRQIIQDVFDRIDVSGYFENAQGYITQGWAANPKTELLQLGDAEAKKWKKVMRESISGMLTGVDPKLVEAIEASR